MAVLSEAQSAQVAERQAALDAVYTQMGLAKAILGKLRIIDEVDYLTSEIVDIDSIWSDIVAEWVTARDAIRAAVLELP